MGNNISLLVLQSKCKGWYFNNLKTMACWVFRNLSGFGSICAIEFSDSSFKTFVQSGSLGASLFAIRVELDAHHRPLGFQGWTHFWFRCMSYLNMSCHTGFSSKANCWYILGLQKTLLGLSYDHQNFISSCYSQSWSWWEHWLSFDWCLICRRCHRLRAHRSQWLSVIIDKLVVSLAECLLRHLLRVERPMPL